MYKTIPEARAVAAEIARGLPEKADGGRQVGIFPSGLCLPAVVEALRGSGAKGAGILVGAQNMHFEKEGAFTGEISAEMILSAGGKAVILGHSERRHVFGESDEWIGKKVLRALEAGLIPVLCVGEKLEEREAGQTFQVVSRQLREGLRGVKSTAQLERLVLAYEPVWAIGTGKTATPQQGQEVQAFLREELGKVYAALGAPAAKAESCRILYGGSVKPENAAELLAQKDIDGLLVGGASLKADSFLKICLAGA